MASSKPKRHHYIPECYLGGFARDGLLFVYDRTRNEYRRQKPKNTAVIGHYYAFTNVDGDIDYGLENELSKFEDLGFKAILKLDAGAGLDAQDRLNLAFFLALLFTRTPKAEREANELADSFVKLTLKEMYPSVEAIEARFAAENEQPSFSAQEFHDFLHGERYEVVGNRNTAIDMMLRQTPEVAWNLATRAWFAVHTPSTHAFLTSDSPFALLLTEEQRRHGTPIGVGAEDVTTAIPLTKETALVVGGRGPRLDHGRASRDLVRLINNGVASECDAYVFGPDEPLVRKVVSRTKLAASRPGSQLVMDHVVHPTIENRSLIITRRIASGPKMPLRVAFESGDEDDAKVPEK